MSQVQIKKCDICGIEKRNDTEKEEYEKGFEEVSIDIGSQYSYSHRYHSNYEIKKAYMSLCSSCLEKIGITRKPKKDEEIKEVLPSDRLFELVAEIVEQVLESRN